MIIIKKEFKEYANAHGGATFYDSAILDIIQEFCIKGMSEEK